MLETMVNSAYAKVTFQDGTSHGVFQNFLVTVEHDPDLGEDDYIERACIRIFTTDAETMETTAESGELPSLRNYFYNVGAIQDTACDAGQDTMYELFPGAKDIVWSPEDVRWFVEC